MGFTISNEVLGLLHDLGMGPLGGHDEKLRPSKPHYPSTKTQKKLVYNYYATIPLEIQCINK